MTEMMVGISSKKCLTSALTSGTKSAWRDYARARWRTHTLWNVQEEWDLTEGEARGVIDGTISQRTIDKIENHKNGGVMLALDLLCVRFRTTLEGVAARMEEQNAHDRDREAARIKRRGSALRSLESVRRGSEEEMK